MRRYALVFGVVLFFALSLSWWAGLSGFEDRFSLASRLFRHRVDSLCSALSIGYFQWDALYGAVVSGDGDFVADILEDLRANFPLVERVSLEEGEISGDKWEVESSGDRLVLRFRVFDDELKRSAPGVLAVAEVSPSRVLEEVGIDFLELHEAGRELAYGVRARASRLPIGSSEVLLSLSVSLLAVVSLRFWEARGRALQESARASLLERERRMLRALLDLSSSALASGDVCPKGLLDRASEVVDGFEEGLVFLRRDGRLVCCSGSGALFLRLDGVEVGLDSLEEGLKRPARLPLRDLLASLSDGFNLDLPQGVLEREALWAPSLGEEGVLAALLLVSREGTSFSERDLEASALLADVLAFVLERIAFQRRLYEMSTRDYLTGMLNRRAFVEMGGKMVAAASRRGEGLCLVFADLDGFKGVNDVFGHRAGDEVLALLASRVKRLVREGDLAARVGGDEFVFLLRDCFSDGAKAFCRRLSSAIEEPIELGEASVSLSCSFGVAVYPEDDLSLEGLMEKADLALYEAKRSRGGVLLYGDLVEGGRAWVPPST